MSVAIFPRDVVDDLLPPFIAEVDIKIRHADALRIEEALKQQIVFQRVNVGDVETVGGEAARSAAASGADHDAVHLGIVNKIPNDEEVVYKPHLLNDAELVFQSRARLVVCLWQFFRHTRIAELPKIRRVIQPVRRNESGHATDSKLNVEIAFFNHICGVGNRVAIVRQGKAHFRLALEVKLIALHAHAIRLVYKTLGLDAEQNILRLGIVGGDIVNVVGDNGFSPDLGGNFTQPRQNLKLFGNVVVLQFDVEILAKHALETLGVIEREVVIVGEQRLRNIASKAGGEADKPLGMLL